MSDSGKTRGLVKAVTGYSSNALRAIYYAIGLISIIIIIGVVVILSSAVGDASNDLLGLKLPNVAEYDYVKGGPFNARTYTGQSNKWAAAGIGLVLAAVLGVASFALATGSEKLLKIELRDDGTLQELAEGATGVAADLAGDLAEGKVI